MAINLGINTVVKSSKKSEKATTMVVSNDVPFVGVTKKDFTCYSKAGKGKVAQQLCLYICPEPSGKAEPAADSIFNGDWKVCYKNGEGLSESLQKTINDNALFPYLTKSDKLGLLLDFKAGELEVSDILTHPEVEAMIDTLVAKLTKPKTLLVKVIPVTDDESGEERNAVIFTSKYVATTCSPTICASISEVFCK